MNKQRVLMVCLGNICRSPLAQGIFEKKLNDLNLTAIVDSAGTSSYHKGAPPHAGSISIAKKHNIDISKQRSRAFVMEDFERFDLIFAMDKSNLNHILSLAKKYTEYQKKVHLLLENVPNTSKTEIPDPYYHGGFDTVYEIIEKGCEAQLKRYFL